MNIVRPPPPDPSYGGHAAVTHAGRSVTEGNVLTMNTTAGSGPTVERLDVSVYTVPTERPESDGTYAWTATTLVLVEAVSGDVTGLGWTYGPPAVASVITGQLAGTVTGSGVYDVPAAHRAMSRALRDTGRSGIAGCALSAVDIALWDLKARVIGLPLAALLGSVRPRVPVYGSGGFVGDGLRQLEEQLRGWTEELAVPRVKIRIGESWGGAPQRDLDRIHLARQIVGDECELYVDAAGAYSRKQAVRVAEAFADDVVSWFEEPVPSDDLPGLREIRDSVTAEVTAGGHGHDLPYFARMADARAVDCLQADVTRCGGITGWLRVAAVAEAHGLEISGHRAPQLHAQVAAAVPNVRHLEWFHDHVRVESDFFDGVLDPAGGAVSPGASGAPGLGLTFKRVDAQRHRTG